MPRRFRNKDVQENSESESDGDDVYLEEDNREESTSSTASQSPSQSPSPTPNPSPAPASASPSPFPETPSLKRVTRSSTLKMKKAVATTLKTPKTLKTSKTPKTPRAIVTRAWVVRKVTAAARGDHPVVSIESAGNTESETDPQLLKIPTTKKPRPSTKRGAAAGGKAQPEGGEVDSEGDVKSVKKPAPKKPRAKAKGCRAGDQPEEEEVDSEADAKPVKTLTPKGSRAKPEGSRAVSEQTKTLATPKKPLAPRPKKIMKASVVTTATAPLIASIQDNEDGDGSPVGLPSKVSSPLDSPMDGIETCGSVASNRDCEMMAMPQQERNGGKQPHRHGYDTVSRSPTALPETSTMDYTVRTGQDWKRATVPTPSSSTPSFLARINNPPSATTTPSAAHLLAPPPTIDDVAKISDKTYDEASQYLLDAMKLTRRALEDQAHAIQFHEIAFQVFEQGLLMSESQCRTLFPQEQFADLATRSALFPLSPLQTPSASAATPLSDTLAPQAQVNTRAQDENLLINAVRNMKRELESPLGQSGYGSAMTRSSSYSSYLPSSRPLSPTSPPPSTPSRSPITPSIPIRHSIRSTASWLSRSDFANDSVQPSIFAHDRQGFPTTTPPPRSSFSSAQASEPLGAPCVSTSLSAMMSAENQHNSLHALQEARRKVLYEHFQRRRDESATQSGAHSQQRDLTPSQQQEIRLVMSTLAGSRVQPEYRIQQQYNQQPNYEMEMGHLKTTAVVGEEARIKDEKPRLMQVQLTWSQWSRVMERSTDVYLKAVKSYEDSRSADRIASESNDQFMDAIKRWYALTSHAFPFD